MTPVTEPTSFASDWPPPLDDLTLLAYDSLDFAAHAIGDVLYRIRLRGGRPSGVSITDLTRGGTITVRIVDAATAEQVAGDLHLDDDRAQVYSGDIGWVRWFDGDYADTVLRIVSVAAEEHPTLRRATVGDQLTVAAVLGGVSL